MNSTTIRVGNVLLNMQHVVALIPEKEDGEDIVRIIFANASLSTNGNKEHFLCGKDATAFVAALPNAQFL
jgi:hypothetical protein